MPTIDQAVATIAGLIATAKIVYDWRREARSDDPALSAECYKLRDGQTLLILRAIRLPTQDYIIHRVRSRGFLFATSRAPTSQLVLDELVKSLAVPSPSDMGTELSWQSFKFVVDPSSRTRKMAEIQVSTSLTARRSRARWKTITVKMID